MFLNDQVQNNQVQNRSAPLVLRRSVPLRIYLQAVIAAAQEALETNRYMPVSAWIEAKLWEQLGQSKTLGCAINPPRISISGELSQEIDSRGLELRTLIQEIT